MVDFRENLAKKQAISIIQRAIAEAEYTRNYIILRVMEKTGLSKKWVNDYIGLLEEEGLITETNDKKLGFKSPI